MENIIKSEKSHYKKINSKEGDSLEVDQVILSLIKVLGGRGGTGRRNVEVVVGIFPVEVRVFSAHQLRI